MFDWIGGLLSGAGSIAGSAISANASKDIARENNQTARDIANQNYQWQKEFAQSGLKWNVDQAKELGINPLVVAGGPGASFSPSSTQVFSPEPADYSHGLSQMGQGIGRAINAVMSKEERAKQNAVDALNLENLQLKNDYIRSQIAASNASIAKNNNAPALPGLALGSKGNPRQAYEYYIFPDGTTRLLPTESASQAFQSNMWTDYSTSVRGAAAEGYSYVRDIFTQPFRNLKDHLFGPLFNSYK